MLLLPSVTGKTLLGRFGIRLGTDADAEACQRIARQWRDELPFVMLPTLREAARRKQLYVAEVDGRAVGFVHWYARRDGTNTIHELAVDRNYTRFGVGRALLYSVPCPIRLKCKADNDRANRFYTNAGMTPDGTETTRGGTPLVRWRLNILAQLVQGNNARMPEVARRSGMAYGTRHIEKAQDWPYALDIHWRDYDWADYMHKVATWRPVQALAPDYEHPSQRRTLYAQIRDLKVAGVLRVMACPKFPGAVAHLPSWCVVAVSVPSTYAGFVPDFAELRGRRVHLLGGSPVKWFGQTSKGKQANPTGYIAAITGAGGRVISVDGNAHTATAAQGGYWRDGRWQFDREAFDLYDLAALSGRNIVAQLNAVSQHQQLALFAA